MKFEEAIKVVEDTHNLKKGELNYGEHSANVMEGVRVTIYNPSPLDQMYNIGKQIETKKRIDELQNEKISYVKELEIRKNTQKIVDALEKEFGIPKISIKENDTDN